jgi:hypothetical protein
MIIMVITQLWQLWMSGLIYAYMVMDVMDMDGYGYDYYIRIQSKCKMAF